MAGRHSRISIGEDLAADVRHLSDDELVEVARVADEEEATLAYELGLLKWRAALVAHELDRRGVARVDGEPRQLRAEDLDGLLGPHGADGLPQLSERATGVLRAALAVLTARLSTSGATLGKIREVTAVAHDEIRRRDNEADT